MNMVESFGRKFFTGKFCSTKVLQAFSYKQHKTQILHVSKKLLSNSLVVSKYKYKKGQKAGIIKSAIVSRHILL